MVSDDKKLLTISEIRRFLGIGKTKAYEYIRKVYEDKTPFQVIKIGAAYRIPKRPFLNYLNGYELKGGETDEL